MTTWATTHLSKNSMRYTKNSTHQTLGDKDEYDNGQHEGNA